MSTALLELEKVDLARGGRLLCRELTLTVEAGECWGVLGPNGAGKSTLLQTMAGLEKPAGGLLRYRGRPLGQWKRRELARELGMLFQLDEGGFTTTLFETVLTGRHPHLGTFGWETAADLEIAWRAVCDLGLEALARRDPATLSGGERQRMEIAVLLAQQPRLALLDEPANHLDPGHQVGILELLRRRFSRPGHAQVMVLHDINLALAFCHRLLLLRGDGHWRAGSVEEMGTPEQLSWLYGCPVRPCAELKDRCLSFL